MGHTTAIPARERLRSDGHTGSWLSADSWREQANSQATRTALARHIHLYAWTRRGGVARHVYPAKAFARKRETARHPCTHRVSDPASSARKAALNGGVKAVAHELGRRLRGEFRRNVRS